MKHIIDGREVETSDFLRASVSDYTVHEGKIWRITARFGPAIGDCKTLERELSREKTSVNNDVKLYIVTKPSGYIRI